MLCEEAKPLSNPLHCSPCKSTIFELVLGASTRWPRQRHAASPTMWGSKALAEDPKSPSGGGLSNAELQKRLKERDSQVELLTQQVAQLMQTTQELQAEIRRNKSTPTLGSRKPPLAAGRDALGPGAPSPSGAATARGPSLGSTSPKGPLKPRTPGGAQTARGGSSTPRLSLGTPRAGSPAPRRPGSATFHASMRGGPLQA